jgi:hypothetical protein
MELTLRNLVCVLAILALVGTASGAGYVAAEKAGIAVPGNQPVAASFHENRGLLSITGESGTGRVTLTNCYFPIINLPAYYVCIMFCKIGGGGDSCAPTCEANLSVCDKT